MPRSPRNSGGTDISQRTIPGFPDTFGPGAELAGMGAEKQRPTIT